MRCEILRANLEWRKKLHQRIWTTKLISPCGKNKIFVCVTASGSTNGTLPSFSWDPTNLSPDGVPLLIVHFPDGGPDDAAILTPHDPMPLIHKSNCIFQGHLRNESKAFVMITGGCPKNNSFEVNNWQFLFCPNQCSLTRH